MAVSGRSFTRRVAQAVPLREDHLVNEDGFHIGDGFELGVKAGAESLEFLGVFNMDALGCGVESMRQPVGAGSGLALFGFRAG